MSNSIPGKFSFTALLAADTVRDHEQQAKSAKKEIKALNYRSQLNNLCDAHKWKHPMYVCCTEEGPAHLRMFTLKVVIEMEKSNTDMEELRCFSAPHRRKKDAAEHAAEGAMWYLKKVGCI